jgi:hypothetical protein
VIEWTREDAGHRDMVNVTFDRYPTDADRAETDLYYEITFRRGNTTVTTDTVDGFTRLECAQRARAIADKFFGRESAN